MRDCVWAATAALPPRPLPPTWSACAAARWGMTGKALCPAGQRIRMAVCRCAHLAAWQTRQATRCFKSALANRPSMLVRSLAKQCFTSLCAPCHTAGCGRAAAAQESVPGCVAPLGGKGHFGYQNHQRRHQRHCWQRCCCSKEASRRRAMQSWQPWHAAIVQPPFTHIKAAATARGAPAAATSGESSDSQEGSQPPRQYSAAEPVVRLVGSTSCRVGRQGGTFVVSRRCDQPWRANCPA